MSEANGTVWVGGVEPVFCCSFEVFEVEFGGEVDEELLVFSDVGAVDVGVVGDGGWWDATGAFGSAASKGD